MITSFIPVGGVQNQLLGDIMFLKAVGCDCSAVRGVGQEAWLGEGIGEGVSQGVASGVESGIGAASGGIWSSIGNFFGSEFGSSLFKAGLTVGGAFAISELTGGGSHGGTPGGVAPGGGGGGGGGTGQPIIIQPAQQSGGTELPSWAMPVAVVGGLGLVAALLLRKG